MSHTTVSDIPAKRVQPLRRVRLFRDMLIDEAFRDLTAYLAVDDEHSAKWGPKPIGTVFFLRLRDGSSTAMYAVTAQHCLDGEEHFYILPRKLATEIQVDADQWVRHETIDLAVCRVDVPLHYGAVIFGADVVPNLHVVAGHDVFTVGLFSKVPGRYGVEPIVRFGHLALPIAEDVPLRLKPLTEPNEASPSTVRLIELHSWSGESGSPVFVYTPHVNVEQEPVYGHSIYQGGQGAQPNTVWASQSAPSLLGVLHGHFDIDRPVESENGWLDVNAGIAVVIRVEDLWEFLMTDERLIEDRKGDQGGRPITPPRPDSANQKEEDTFTREDFENALKKVSRRIQPSQSDEEK